MRQSLFCLVWYSGLEAPRYEDACVRSGAGPETRLSLKASEGRSSWLQKTALWIQNAVLMFFVRLRLNSSSS